MSKVEDELRRLYPSLFRKPPPVDGSTWKTGIGYVQAGKKRKAKKRKGCR